MQNYYFLTKHETKFDLDPAHYNPLGRGENESNSFDDIQRKYPSTQNYPCPESIKLSVWAFFGSEEEVNIFMGIVDNCEVQKFLENKMGESPKGASRLILIELLCSIKKFVNKMRFTAEQIATLYAIFLLTHEFFTSSIYISAETVFQYFKDFVMIHSINLFPDCQEVFHNDNVTPKILEYFAKLYLRHLPLIRLLTKPNFSYNVMYEVPRETAVGKSKKGKKEKKEKKGKAYKKSKKKK